jgi:glycosyltransferase involved in cell wall biosynthesis
MACGLPALVSDIAGNREWVEPGINGWWFERGSVNSLVRGLEGALENRDNLEPLGLAARNIVVQRADWSKNFQKLLEAYELALSRHSANNR